MRAGHGQPFNQILVTDIVQTMFAITDLAQSHQPEVEMFRGH